MAKIEINILHPDELCLGLHMANGEDEHGVFHMTTIGFLLFDISFIKYFKEL